MGIRLRKLVAIGNFKENYKTALYSDAPELLEQLGSRLSNITSSSLTFRQTKVTLPGHHSTKDC